MTVARRQFIAGLLGGTGAVFTPAVLARESARARVRGDSSIAARAQPDQQRGSSAVSRVS